MEDLELANERIEEVLKNETPLRKKEGQVYSIAANNFYHKIKALRSRGFSFVQICGAFEKIGVLSGESNPYSFRQAFVRESTKRERTNELLRELKDDLATKEPEKTSQKDANTRKEESYKSNPDSMDESIRKLTGVVVDTGLGKIVKHADGSFEY